jgi:hypothetical protein
MRGVYGFRKTFAGACKSASSRDLYALRQRVAPVRIYNDAMQNAAEQLEPLETPAERFNGGRVKGVMVRAHVDWVRDHRDRDEVIEFFEALPRPMRTVLAASWYEFADVVALDRVIMDRFGHGELSFLQELGAYSARQSLTGVYRFFQRSGVHEFFRRSALLHGQFQDFGTARYDERAGTAGRMIHSHYSSYSPLYCASAIGFYRECIRLHGGMRIEVWETECQCRGDAACVFEMIWE